MTRLVFSSEQLAAELDDAERFALWQELYVGTVCKFDVKRLADRPFAMRYEFAEFGAVALVRCQGTVGEFTRTRHQAASESNDSLLLNFNGNNSWSMSLPTGDYNYRPGVCSFLGGPGIMHTRHHGGTDWTGIMVPRQRLRESVPDIEDHSGAELDSSSEIVRHLCRYTTMLLKGEDDGSDSTLAAHIETTLLDLMGLAFKGRRDAADLAKMRGLRAARLQAILGEIKRGFADPAFAPAVVAGKLRCSENYVQKLLHESGATFSERVLELRLQKVRGMLASPRHDGMRIIEIAFACGFNDVSYFNRCFRRRFGDAPTQWRGERRHDPA
ncbi:MAG TPA: AraC family transcriptional regulator [Pseudolabrys sp.]|nr:AraC family transcriptional regulator [Pseudolabrys sp.]